MRSSARWRRLRRFGRGLALAALLPSVALGLTPAPDSGACSLEGVAPATVAAVDETFELLLDDGRRGALSGLEFPQGPARAAARARLADWLVGRDVLVGDLGAGRDRWGRAPMRVYAASDEAQAPLVSVATAMLEEGRARFRPEPRAAACATLYLEAEAAARVAGRGLWSGERPFAAGVEATGPLMRRKGMAIVEGTVSHVGETRSAIYLNFAENGPKNVSAMISRRNLIILAKLGIGRDELRGRRVRVRGLIETGFGPRIEIFAPAQIEILQ
jgi:hypothetical protein